MSSDRVSLVLTCEHGGREVPARYRALFESPAARSALDSHRGWDPGTVELGETMARALRAPLVVQHTTRLLVECNRSLGRPRLWSEFSRDLPVPEKERVLREVWRPHRDAVRDAIDDAPPGLVVHVGVHSFTPVWKGRPRATEVGLLYDPARGSEVRVVRAWIRALREHGATAALTIHRNRPYRGWTDGLVTELRAARSESRYAGIELEVSQSLMPASAGLVDGLAAGLAQAIVEVSGTGAPLAPDTPDP